MEISLRDLLTVLHGMGFGALFMLRAQWLRWSSTSSQTHDGVAIGGAHAME